MVSFRHRTPQERDAAQKSKLMVLGALAALEAVGGGIVPQVPMGASPPMVDPLAAPAPLPGGPAPGMGGAAPMAQASPAAQAPMGIPAGSNPVGPPVPTPSLLAGGGVISEPSGMIPPDGMAPSPAGVDPDADVEGTIPNAKLFDLAAKRIMRQGRSPMAGEPAAEAARADMGSQPAAALMPNESERGSAFDYLLENADAPPAPASFTSWLQDAAAGASRMGAILAKAYAANPDLDGPIFQAAKDIAAEAPSEFPEHIRRILQGAR